MHSSNWPCTTLDVNGNCQQWKYQGVGGVGYMGGVGTAQGCTEQDKGGVQVKLGTLCLPTTRAVNG